MFHKILVALDRSPNSKAVFDHALALTKVTEASLMLLHVLSSEEKDSPQLPPMTTLEYYPLDFIGNSATLSDVENVPSYSQNSSLFES